MSRGRTIKLVAAVICAAALSGPPARAELPGYNSGILALLMGDAASDRFGRFVHDFWPEAHRAGISRRVYELAFRGVGPDPPRNAGAVRFRPEIMHEAPEPVGCRIAHQQGEDSAVVARQLGPRRRAGAALRHRSPPRRA